MNFILRNIFINFVIILIKKVLKKHLSRNSLLNSKISLKPVTLNKLSYDFLHNLKLKKRLLLLIKESLDSKRN
jgi:hypothetical protein